MKETIENVNKNAESNDAITKKTKEELNNLETDIIKQFKEKKDTLSNYSELDSERLNYWKKLSD